MKYYLPAIMLSLLAATNMAAANAQNHQNYAGNQGAGSHEQTSDKSIMVKPGRQSLTVKLKANATTGFNWFVQDYDHSLLSLKSYHYQAEKTKRLGAGGVSVFVFALKQAMFAGPQMTDIIFNYARPWTGPSATSKTIHVVSMGNQGHNSQSDQDQANTGSAASLKDGDLAKSSMTLATGPQLPSTQMPHMRGQGQGAPSSNVDHHAKSWLTLPHGTGSSAS